MSSSRKNIFAWLILAASAVLIAGGLSVLRSQSLLGETDTVVEYSTAVATSIQETAIHVPTTDAAEQSNNSIEAADEMNRSMTLIIIALLFVFLVLSAF